MERKDVRVTVHPVDLSSLRIRRFKRVFIADAILDEEDHVWWMTLRRPIVLRNPTNEAWHGVALYADNDLRFDLFRRIILPGDTITLQQMEVPV